MSNLYLQHHGIKGMKWGIRRYQNPDGSLTPEGQKRYGLDSDGKIHTYRSDTNVTKRVKSDFNTLSSKEFFKKYGASREQYAKRVKKYGDPYKRTLTNLEKRGSSKDTIDTVKKTAELEANGKIYKSKLSKKDKQVIVASALAAIGATAISAYAVNAAYTKGMTSGANIYRNNYLDSLTGSSYWAALKDMPMADLSKLDLY